MKSASVLIVVAAIGISGVLVQPRTKIAAAKSVESRDATRTERSLEQQIVSKEREGLDALKAGDIERFGDLTADEAVMVDTQGPATKSDVLKHVAGFRLTDYSMGDVRFVPISPNTGLISYKIVEKGVSHGKEFSAQVYVSSVWTERQNKWACLFSQETAAR
jgi:ketosteroid isomerase-like protein